MSADAYYLGLDVGSAASKAVIVDDAGEIRAKAVYPAGAGTPGPETVVRQVLDEVGIERDGLVASCATGYGRHLFDWTDYEMSELSCHAKGAVRLFPGVRTVIDIGGQDAKVLSIGEDGKLQSFVMNDKCAAGTGRFLEVMAQVFGCDVSDLSEFDRQSTQVASISSTCTVFAESEVISKLASGTPIPDIAAGVDSSVVERTYGLVKRLGVVPKVAMTGGVALNGALRERLAERIGQPIMTSEISQFNGALGAALYALEKHARA